MPRCGNRGSGSPSCRRLSRVSAGEVVVHKNVIGPLERPTRDIAEFGTTHVKARQIDPVDYLRGLEQNATLPGQPTTCGTRRSISPTLIEPARQTIPETDEPGGSTIRSEPTPTGGSSTHSASVEEPNNHQNQGDFERNRAHRMNDRVGRRTRLATTILFIRGETQNSES